jgi:spermidine/putrescine transport system ATP-binding protein
VPSRELSLLYATWALCYVCGTFHRPLTREGVLPLSLVRMQPESPPSGPRERSQSSPFAKPAVELTSVRLAYRDSLVLRGLDLTIGEGEFFSLLGPSGCGKTSTLAIIGGFIEPDAGEVRILGRSMRGVAAHRRPVNTVFQNYALFPHLSVEENVGFGPRMRGLPRPEIARAVSEALALVSLEGMERRRPDQLSGGQQQRVALARAIINKPTVLLLDEPLGALDLKMRKQMQSELVRIHREIGITFVYVTHDQEEAMTMSDRIAVMADGGIVQIGAPRDLFERPASLFVADFIGASNLLAGSLLEARLGRATVRLAAGGIGTAMAPQGPLRAGEAVTLVVRPDQLALGTADAGESNALRATVTRVSHIGTYIEVAVRTASGEELIARHPPPESSDALPAVDDVLFVSWRHEKAMCFEGTFEGNSQ